VTFARDCRIFRSRGKGQSYWRERAATAGEVAEVAKSSRITKAGTEANKGEDKYVYIHRYAYTYTYIYVYIDIYMSIHIHIYIDIYIERERERDTYLYVCVYI